MRFLYLKGWRYISIQQGLRFRFDSELQIEQKIFIQQNSIVHCPLLLPKLQVFWNCRKLYFLGVFYHFLEHEQTLPSSFLSILSLQEEEWNYVPSPFI